MISADTIVASASALFAGVGLFFTWWGLRSESLTRQLQIFDNSFNNVNQTIQLLYDKYEQESEERKKQWDSQLFNQVEYLAFLVNKRYLRDREMLSFFEDAIVDWYEQIFLKHHGTEEVDNPKVYPEMKTLYRRLKT
jgi:hypothetical protein